MSARIKTSVLLLISMGLLSASLSAWAESISPIQQEPLSTQLGWEPSTDNKCGGYYLEDAFVYPENTNKKGSIAVTGSQGVFSLHGTTVLEGKVSLMRFGQQITANKASLYRETNTGKITSMDIMGNVHLREPNTLVIAKRGHYDFESRNESLMDILYRTSLKMGSLAPTQKLTTADIQKQRKIYSLTAWGQAEEFSQTETNVYEMYRGSFSTCTPTNPAWRVKASHIVLDKNTGRGTATHARIYVKSIPVVYLPYFNFSIDHQRKTGFLWPSFGNRNSSPGTYSGWGTYILSPFYWNLAPNFDMTITPGILSERGVYITDKFRYLSQLGGGSLNVSILPGDRLFKTFQEVENTVYASSTNNVTQASLSRLLNASSTRKSLLWRDDMRFNSHWSSHIDFSYAGDDYYLRDFGNLNEVTQNTLLQEGDLYYKGKNWNFIGRLQTYQMLHPITVNEPPVQNQYRRFPQLILNGDYPDQAYGMHYFIDTEATHFDIRNTPGTPKNQPLGNRFHLQPGIGMPRYWPYFFINPRMQLSMTGYDLYQTNATQAPTAAQRTIPIFDMLFGFAFDRRTTLFHHVFQQTLEPQIYYTYIPYRNQASIPIFDTTVNELTYDQVFNYNRFSSIDRIGDANQVGIGISSRMLDSETGLEKIRVGVAEIVYFANRRVTFCNNLSCVDNPTNLYNTWRLSPISGIFNYALSPFWNFESKVNFNPISKQLGNATVGLHVNPEPRKVFNLGYGYVFKGDPLAGATENSGQNNLKLTNFSFSWPLTEDWGIVGLWSQNWNQQHLQNAIYGVQYDTCCWAMRFVGGRTFLSLTTTQNNTPVYSSDFFIQFTLKGLGNIGKGDPTALLSTITGYNTQFGQEF